MDRWKNEEWVDGNMAGPRLKQGWKMVGCTVKCNVCLLTSS